MSVPPESAASPAPAPPRPPPLELLEMDVSEIGRYPDALAGIMRRKRLGLVIRGAFPGEPLAAVVSRLEAGDCALSRHDTPFKGRSYGAIVVLSGTDLTDYLAEGEKFRDACAALFQGATDYQTRMEDLLRRLAGGRKVAVPRGPDGRSYMGSSIRGVAPGGAIDLHCENETVGFPGMKHLSTLIDPRHQLSYYLTLAAPESGGEIWISRLRFSEGPGRALLNLERDTEDTLRRVEAYGGTAPRLTAGDLLIFDAGSHYHRVTPVTGAKTRWTMGGFLALSRDHSTVYYWS
jgi:hypothetical protein